MNRGFLARLFYWDCALECCGHPAWQHDMRTRLCRRWFDSEWIDEIQKARQRWIELGNAVWMEAK